MSYVNSLKNNRKMLGKNINLHFESSDFFSSNGNIEKDNRVVFIRNFYSSRHSRQEKKRCIISCEGERL